MEIDNFKQKTEFCLMPEFGNFHSDICRVCLTQNSSLLSLFTRHSSENTIAGVILFVAGIDIQENDKFPQFVCNNCLGKLEEAYQIKWKCIESDQQMKKYLFANDITVKKEEDFYDNEVDENALDPILNLEEVEIKQEDDIKEQYLSESDNDKHECNGCYGKFSTRISLKKHKESSCSKFLHTCEICHETVRFRIEFIKHMRQHSKKCDTPVDQCDKCGKKFYFRGKIDKHVCVAMKKNCYYCNQECPSKKGVIRHIEREHRIDGYFPCPFEGCEERKLICAKTIYYHLEGHYDPVNLVCSVCGKLFTDRNLYWGHAKMHRDKNRYACDICGVKVYQKDKILRHLKQVHLKERNHLCDQCSASFKDPQQLKRHQVREHGAVGKFKCETCGFQFIQKHSLMNHMKTHMEKPKVFCEICSADFRHNAELTNHIQMVHERKTNYQCDICYKYFNRQYDLTIHRRRHSNDTRHECNYCGKKLLTKSCLVAHLRVHTGDRPFSCYLCDKKYKDRQSAKKHLKKFHKIENPDVKRLRDLPK